MAVNFPGAGPAPDPPFSVRPPQIPGAGPTPDPPFSFRTPRIPGAGPALDPPFSVRPPRIPGAGPRGMVSHDWHDQVRIAPSPLCSKSKLHVH